MQPTLRTIDDLMQQIAPLNLSAEFDNSGLQCGDWTQPISRILLCVDCTEQVADEAAALGCNLIIAHHPLLFTPLRRVCEQDGLERILRKLIRSDIALLASHTNTDYAKDGLCEVLSGLFGIVDAEVAEPVGVGGDGYGRVGNIPETSVEQLAIAAKRILSATSVRYTGSGDRRITRLAVLSGSGTSALGACLSLGAQCAITGDVRYSQGVEYARKELSIIDAGHYDTEKVILLVWLNHLQNRLHTLEYHVDLMISSAGADIFSQV